MSFATSMRYLDWGYAAGAAIQSILHHKRLQADPTASNPRWKPDADTWAIYSAARQQVLGEVRRQWCLLSGIDEQKFPLSEDAAARLYYRFRKRNDEELESFRRQINERLEELRCRQSIPQFPCSKCGVIYTPGHLAAAHPDVRRIRRDDDDNEAGDES